MAHRVRFGRRQNRALSDGDLRRVTKYVNEVISRSWGNARLWGMQMEREIGATERKPVIKAVLLILLGILISSFCFKLIFVNHMEEKITSIPSKKQDSVSIQDYATTYDAISGATGNYITGVAAFLTLVLLAFQYYEIRDSKMRYLEDKRRAKIESEKNDIDRFIKRVEDRISNTEFVFRGVAHESGIGAYVEFANRLEKYFDVLNLENSDRGQEVFISAMNEVVGELTYVLIALQKIGTLAKEYEKESIAYFKSVYILDGSEVFRLLSISLSATLWKGPKTIKGNRKEIEYLYLMFWRLLEWTNVFDGLNSPDHVDAPILMLSGDDNFKYQFTLDVKYFL